MDTVGGSPPDRSVVDRAPGAAAGGSRVEVAGERIVGVDGAPQDEAGAQATADKHAQFCNKVGLQPVGGPVASSPGSRITVPCTDPVEYGYCHEISLAYKHHSWQYWFIASLINTLHLSQIIIGATATALGSAGVANRATKSRNTAITVLTTIMTVIAAVLVYFKSRGQPNRVRQLRNDLRKVLDYIKFTEIEFREPAFGPSVEVALNKVKSLYDSARANAETNYPDTWSTAPGSSGKQPSIP